MKSKDAVDHMCFGCSPYNPIGLKLKFQWDGDTLFTVFKPREEHQGYNGCMHGGLISTVMDETMAQWLWLRKIPCMTAEMSIRFSKGVPIGREFKVVSRCTLNRRDRLYEMKAQLILDDGTVAVRSTAKFLRVDPDEFK